MRNTNIYKYVKKKRQEKFELNFTESEKQNISKWFRYD